MSAPEERFVVIDYAAKIDGPYIQHFFPRSVFAKSRRLGWVTKYHATPRDLKLWVQEWVQQEEHAFVAYWKKESILQFPCHADDVRLGEPFEVMLPPALQPDRRALCAWLPPGWRKPTDVR